MCEFGKKNDCMYILANDPQDQNKKRYGRGVFVEKNARLSDWCSSEFY